MKAYLLMQNEDSRFPKRRIGAFRKFEKAQNAMKERAEEIMMNMPLRIIDEDERSIGIGWNNTNDNNPYANVWIEEIDIK